MARRSRVVLNRAALDEIAGGLADGTFDIAAAIATRAAQRAPDEPPYGEGLVDHGGAAVWVDGRKVAEMTTGGVGSVNKPRGFVLKRAGSRIAAAVGFDFPAMFQEAGTIRQPARPFVTPAAIDVLGSDARILLSAAMERRLRGERSPNTARIRAKIAASRALAAS
jgi:hypothetical protein